MYKKILVAFDGSEASKHSLDHAVNFAEHFGAELLILSVVPRVMMPVFPDEGFGAAPITAAQDMGEYQDKMKEIYNKSLNEAKNDINDHFPDMKIEIKLLEGKPSSMIVNTAEEFDVDLIVIGRASLAGFWVAPAGTSLRAVPSRSLS